MYGDILPHALGIAISPVPVIATILLLLSPRATATSAAFAVGWVGGIALAVVAFDLLGGLLAGRGGGPGGAAGGIVHLVLGALLLLLALRTFRRRPREGEQPRLPAWMTAIDEISPLKALGLAAALVLANPKNLVMAASTGITLAAIPAAGPQVLGTVVFVLVAATTVIVPVIAHFAASARLSAPLDALREWLTRHSAAVMTVLLVVLALQNIGKAVDAL